MKINWRRGETRESARKSEHKYSHSWWTRSGIKKFFNRLGHHRIRMSQRLLLRKWQIDDDLVFDTIDETANPWSWD